MNHYTANQPKLSYEERLTADLQSILADSGIDASTHPNQYGFLVGALADFVSAQTRRSFLNGRKFTGRGPRPRRDTRFDIAGKPSAMKAGKILAAVDESEEEIHDAFTAEESLLEEVR